MPSSCKPPSTTPRIIIHGGAGNITRQNLTKDAYTSYRIALVDILWSANDLLTKHHASALDAATHAVSLLENNPLFNSGHGAVFTTAGTIELEASVMVSRGYRKRGVGVMKVSRVKNPILLAKEMLVRGEQDGGGGAQGHCQLEGETCDRLAGEWGLDLVSPSYFWTKRRWDEHRRGLGLGTDRESYRKGKKEVDGVHDDVADIGGDDRDFKVTNDPSWDGHDYLPQGTVGCVVLDHSGTLCVATSTGGLTNKLPGRIGDTPTLGAGFWAEEWLEHSPLSSQPQQSWFSIAPLSSAISSCLPQLGAYLPLSQHEEKPDHTRPPPSHRGAAMSGTGNGDSFLRLSAVRTAAAISRFSDRSLQTSVTAMAGPYGMLQQSAEDRWHKTGEGEGGIIGIEWVGSRGRVVADFNCGGMFRAWVDESGESRMMVFRDEF